MITTLTRVTECARCGVDVELAPTDLPAPSQPGRRVCATEAGEVGAIACGITDTELAIKNDIAQAAHQHGERGDFIAAATAAQPLLDAMAEEIASYTVMEESAWLHIAAYASMRAALLRGGQ